VVRRGSDLGLYLFSVCRSEEAWEEILRVFVSRPVGLGACPDHG
jgi:hypothetical protein